MIEAAIGEIRKNIQMKDIKDGQVILPDVYC